MTISTLAGLIKPELRADGTVVVDMGEPLLQAADVPTTLPTDGEGRAIEAPLEVAGKEWLMTCVGMGNPHVSGLCGLSRSRDCGADRMTAVRRAAGDHVCRRP